MSKKDTHQSDLAVQVEELTHDLKRVQAEFVNFKRRIEEEKTELLDFAKNRVVREFLAVRDNFDREQAGRPTDVDPAWAASIDAIRKQFDGVLAGLGVERFDSKGHAFDPHRHEAVVMADGEGEHEVVLEEFQPGYQSGGTVLRHAVVKAGHSQIAPPEAAGNEEAARVIAEEKQEPEDVQPDGGEIKED